MPSRPPAHRRAPAAARFIAAAVCVALTFGLRARATAAQAAAPPPVTIIRPADAGAPWTDDERTRLRPALDEILARAPTLAGAHVGLLVLDARDGTLLAAHAADDAFVPASTLKLVTGSAALAQLGPRYRFHTEAAFDPATQTLVVRAGGDPLLTSANVSELAAAAPAPAVRRVAVDTRAFADDSPEGGAAYPPGWAWDDLGFDYGAPITALAVDENAFALIVAPGTRAGDPVRASPVAAHVACPPSTTAENGTPWMPSIRSDVLTGAAASPDTIDASVTPQDGVIGVTGSLALDARPDTLGFARRAPMAYARALIAACLTSRGASFDDRDSAGVIPPRANVVWTHDGEPLSALLADMWQPSDNFIAEMLLRGVGREASREPGSTANGIAAERAWLASIGVDAASLDIVDGSGLSAYDRLTPRALGAVLVADWRAPWRATMLDALPVAGVRGTLAHALHGSPAEGRTFAKTGSVMHARGLAGYLQTQRHGAVAFVLLVDDWRGTDAGLDTLRARLLSLIAGA